MILSDPFRCDFYVDMINLYEDLESKKLGADIPRHTWTTVSPPPATGAVAVKALERERKASRVASVFILGTARGNNTQIDCQPYVCIIYVYIYIYTTVHLQ